MFRYRLIDNYAYDKVKLVIGQASVQAKLAPHRLFAHVKSIELNNDELNLKCFELIQKGQIEIAPQKSTEFVRRCKQVFNLDLELNLTEIGIGLLVNNSDQDINKLDLLQFNDLLLVIKIAFDKTPAKFHTKVIRKIKNYVANCKRRQEQKDNLQKLLKWYKDNQKGEELQDVEQKQQAVEKRVEKVKKFVKKQQSDKLSVQPDSQQRSTENIKSEDSAQRIEEELADQIKPTQKYQRRSKRQHQENNNWQQPQDQDEKKNGRGRDNRMRQSKAKGGRSNDRYGGGSMGKQKKNDPKIMLGISGDTEAGWRQRYRPTRVPAGSNLTVDRPNNNKPQSNYKFDPKSYSTKPSNNKPERQQKSSPTKQAYEPKSQEIKREPVKSEAQNPSQSPSKQNKDLLFIYPQDGVEFDFSRIKNSFRLFVNGTFWVNYNNGKLQIKRGQKGYVRESKIDVLKNGFMAEGLTIRLGDSSNIEDGGDAFGDPTIQDFTNTPSQFFHVITLQVYRYESSNLPVASKDAKKQNPKLLKQPAPKQKSQQKNQTKLLTPKKEDKKSQKANNDLSSKSKKQKPSDNQEDWEDEDGQVHDQQTEVPQVEIKKDLVVPSIKKQKTEKSYSNQQKSQQPKEKNTLRVQQTKNSKSRSKSKQGRGRSHQKNENHQKSKQKIVDPQILLGIKGDSQVGWRERNRPSHSPARNNDREVGKENQEQNQATKTQKAQKVQNQVYQTKGNQKLLFDYPKDGKKFDFTQIKSGFRLVVNKRFSIHYEGGKLEIKKGENGYSRDSHLDIMQNGFMAEGLTISLEGHSHIEDGGDELGIPSIEDFTQNKTQYFSVNELQVYKL